MELKNLSHLGYTIERSAGHHNDPIAVRQAAYDEHAWAAFIVNANAVGLLRRAVETGDRLYDPRGAAQFVYSQARDETTCGSYIIPITTRLKTRITPQFGEMWAPQVSVQHVSSPRCVSLRSTALWLIFWAITNVSTSFYAIELSPRFFYWGRAWPLQQIITASRTLLFGTRHAMEGRG